MDDKAYEQFVAAVVRGMSFSDKTQVFTNKHYRGVRQPGVYEIDVSCEMWIDAALFFLIIVECKNWARPIDGSGFMNHKVGGILFIVAGVAFFVTALMAEQRVFYGVGFPFVGLGVALLIGVSKKAERKG